MAAVNQGPLPPTNTTTTTTTTIDAAIPHHPNPQTQSQSPSPTSNAPNPNGNLAQNPSNSTSSAGTAAKPTRPSSSTTPLSCVLCRQRKVKCDKAETCSTCQRAGVKCVKLARQRLPRGRNGGRRKADTELKARIGKLENLVKTLGAGVKPSKDDPQASAKTGSPTTETQRQTSPREALNRVAQSDSPRSSNAGSSGSGSGNNLNQYIGSSFWVSLSDEIAGIREVLENSSDDESEHEDSDDNLSFSTSNDASGNLKFILFDRNSFVLDPNALQHPPRSQIQLFCMQYLRHVDPMVKLLHGPTLRKYMVEGGSYLDYKPNDVALDAISFAVYYGAVTTMSDHDCVMRLGEGKKALLEQYRFGAETAIARADLMNTQDILALQAMIIFIVVLRHDDHSRLAWSLLAVAIRVAFAQGLHRETVGATVKPFEREIRRRTWYQLLLCDMQASMDRSTEPLIHNESFNTRPPLNINDADISYDSDLPVLPRDGFTDMSFILLVQIFRPVILQLNFVPCGHYDNPPTEMESNWQMRRQLVLAARREVETRIFKYADKGNPFQFFTCLVADSIYLLMLLMAVRPLQRHPQVKQPRVSGAHILSIAVQVLEHGQRMDAENSIVPWRWYSGSWNKWHPLSVCLAELCILTEGPDVERAWNVVDTSFNYTKSYVADTSKGMLWRPIEKLMKKAQSRRTAALQNRCLEAVQQQDNFQGSNPASMSPEPNTNTNGTSSMLNTPVTAMEQDFTSVNTPFNLNFPTMSDEYAPDQTMLTNDRAGWGDWILQDGMNQNYNDSNSKGDMDTNSPPIVDSGWTHWDKFVSECYGDPSGNYMAIDMPPAPPDTNQPPVQWAAF